MNYTEKLFTSTEVARAIGVDAETIDKWAETVKGYVEKFSALTAIHFALVKALTDCGCSFPLANAFSSGIGFAASIEPIAGLVLIRKQGPEASGHICDGGPEWVEVGSHEVT